MFDYLARHGLMSSTQSAGSSTIPGPFPKAVTLPAISLATKWDDYDNAGDGFITALDTVQNPTTIGLTTRVASERAAISKELTAFSVTTKDLRFLVKCSNWAATTNASMFFSSNGYTLTNTFIVDFKARLQNSPNNEWIELIVPIAGTERQGTVNLANITLALMILRDDGTERVTLSVNAVDSFDKVSKPMISICVDDGLAATMPSKSLMEAKGWVGTLFVTPADIGAASYLTQEQLDTFNASGWDIGGHGNTNLKTLSLPEVDTYLKETSNWLKGKNYKGADLFAYPDGSWNTAINEKVAKYFSCGFNIEGYIQPAAYVSPYRINRHSIDRYTTQTQVRAWVNQAIDDGAWCILNFHSFVTTLAADKDWTIANFTSLLTYIQGTSVSVFPISTALEQLRGQITVAGSIADAPSDGLNYVRKNASWVKSSNTELVATDYDVKVDARRLLNLTKSPTTDIVECPEGNFTAADIGKRVRIYSIDSGAHIGSSKVQDIYSPTTIKLANILPLEVITDEKVVCWIGTDNHTELQELLNYAGSLAKASSLTDQYTLQQRTGTVIVTVPPSVDGSGCLTTNTLIVPRGVCLNAGAMIVSDCGVASISDREWVVEVKAGATVEKLAIDAMWGMGVKFGDPTQYSRSHLGSVEVWNVGTNYNAALPIQRQTGAYFTGNDWSIDDLWIKGGNVSLQLDSCSNFTAKQISVVNSINALRMLNTEKVHVKNLLLDTISWVGIVMDACSNVFMDVKATVNTDAFPDITQTYGIMLGEYNTTSGRNKNIHITYNGQSTGGTAVKIKNTADSTIVCNLSNERLLVSSTAVRPITKAIEYSTGNYGYLNVDANIPEVLNSTSDANTIINPSSGTRYGTLRVNGVDVANPPITVSDTAPSSPTLNQLWLDIS